MFISRHIIIFVFILSFLSSNLFAQSWQAINTGLNGKIAMQTSAINPQNPNEIFAGLKRGGLYKTENSGKDWQEIHKEIFAAADISNVLVNPEHTNIIYVTSFSNGIWKSIDSGNNWVAIQGFPKNHPIFQQLIMDPKNPDILYVVLLRHGIFKTIDGGNHWSQIGKTLSAFNFIHLDVSAADPNNLILTTYNNNVLTQLFSSVDGGKTWTRLPQVNNFYVFTVRFARDTPNIMYAIGNGFYQSKDGGYTWSLLHSTDSQHEVNQFLIDNKNTNIIYIYVQYEGFYKTLDAGKTWSLISSELNNADEWTLLYQHPALSNHLYFTSREYGFAQSNDAGQHWTLTNNGIFNANIKTLAVDLQNSDVAYAGNEEGLWVMHDGKTWIRDTQFAGKDIDNIAIDPNNSLHLLVTAKDSAEKEKIYLSEDKGNTWKQAISSQGFYEMASNTFLFDINDTRVVYALENFGNLWKSNDNGLSWNILYDFDGSVLNTFAMNPKNNQEIFVGAMRQGNNLLYKTSDGGKNWKNLTSNLAPKKPTGHSNDEVFALAYGPSEVNTIYAVARVQDILHFYRSIDGGNNWQMIDESGLENLTSASTLLFDPNNTTTLYLNSGYCNVWCQEIGAGVLVSYDRGKHWQTLNTGLLNTNTMSLAISKKALWTGTEGNGVFKWAFDTGN